MNNTKNNAADTFMMKLASFIVNKRAAFLVFLQLHVYTALPVFQK